MSDLELRLYWSIIRARLWLVVLLAALALAFSAVYTPRTISSFKATVRLAVRPSAEQSSSSFYTYDEYYAYVASEYLNDDVGKIVEGGSFQTALQARAQRDYGRVPTGSLETKKVHRVLSIDATSGTADDALLLTRVASEMLAEPHAPYFASITAQNPRVTVIDPPAITGSTPPSRVGLDIAIRTLLGLLTGIALAFLLNYLDDTVRDRADIEENLGLQVLAEVPSRGRAPRAATRGA